MIQRYEEWDGNWNSIYLSNIIVLIVREEGNLQCGNMHCLTLCEANIQHPGLSYFMNITLPFSFRVFSLWTFCILFIDVVNEQVECFNFWPTMGNAGFNLFSQYRLTSILFKEMFLKYFNVLNAFRRHMKTEINKSD